MGGKGDSIRECARHPRRRPSGVVGLGAAVGVLALSVAACGGDGDDAAEGSDTDTTDTTEAEEATAAGDATAGETVSQEDLDQAVLDAYEASEEASLAAYDPPNPDHADLLATHVGERLTISQDHLRDLQERGVSWIGTSESSSTVMSRDEHNAVVRVCVLDDLTEVNTESGNVVDDFSDHPRSPAHLDITMRQVDGIWKAAETDDLEEPCDVDQYAD